LNAINQSSKASTHVSEFEPPPTGCLGVLNAPILVVYFPKTAIRKFEGDQELLMAAHKVRYDKGDVVEGTIGSADVKSLNPCE
jgi:hypothetical protein